MNILKKTISILTVILGVITVSQAQNIQYTLLSSNKNEAVVRVDFGTYHTETVDVNGEEMQTLHMESAYPVMKAGSPELLLTAFSLIIPEGSHPESEVIDAQYSEIPNFKLAPSKGKLYRNENPANVPYRKNETYLSSDYLLGKASNVGNTYQLRDYQGINIKVYPFDYNPAQQTLKVYSSITVKVTFNGGRNFATAQKNNRTFDALYAQQFLNYNTLRGNPIIEEGDILIIAPENFMASMQPYADWKIRNGFRTEIVSLAIAGNNTNAIKSFIANYYDEHNLAFVIIVGDHAQFPTPTIGGDKCDNFFTELVGNDSYPDIILGKISAENISEVATQVQRFIEYEQNPPETTHFTSFMGIASNQGPGDNNEYDHQHVRNIDNKLQNYTYVSGYELFEGSQGGLDAPGDPTSSMVAAGVNEGVGIISYTGHGANNSWVTSGFNNSDVNALTNMGKLPFILSVACVNGEYHTGTCFAESWLRATKNGQPTGAVGFTGSTINQPWNSPMCAQDAMIDLLVGTTPANQKFTYGGMFFNGMIKMLDVYNDVEVFRTWILFGDPALKMRTAVPQELELSYSNFLPVGVPSVTFSSMAENATVAITKNGEIIGTGRIVNGEFTLLFDEVYLPTDTLFVLANATNYLPYEGTLNFIPNEGPYVVSDVMTMNELNESSTFIHHNDGLAEYGEALVANLSFINIGNAPANDIRVKITSDDENITLNNNEFTINSIAAHDMITKEHAFNIFVSKEAPANHSTKLNVSIFFGNDSVKQSKFIMLYAPTPTINSLFIDDTEEGNGNHRVDFGETFTCKVNLGNIGNLQAVPGTLFLSNPGEELSLEVTSVPVLSVEPNGTTTAIFKATVRDSIQEPTITNVKAVYYVHYYRVSAFLPIKIGAVVEDWESGDFTNMTWQNNSSMPWTIVASSPYEGTYCIKSGAISNSRSTRISISAESSVADTISFYYKVSSEESYDLLSFKIDGQTKNEWSGNIGWTRAAYPITPGSHTYTWTYSKDSYGTSGHDCAYLDFISFPCGKVNVPVSIEEIPQDALDFKVWPNPTTDYLYVQTNEEQDCTYQLLSLNGKLLQGGRLDNNAEINIKNFTSGIYILKVENTKHQVFTTKIVKR